MRSLAIVNTTLPTMEDTIQYTSGESLVDYDIVVFDPKIPHMSRERFSAGDSCITIEDTKTVRRSISHWSNEITVALRNGKTIYFLLAEQKIDYGAISADSPRKGSTTYNTIPVDNYSVLPFSLSVRNTKGRKIRIDNEQFGGLSAAIYNEVGYRVTIDSTATKKIFSTRDGSGVVAAIMKLEGSPGNLVFLPYINFYELADDEQDDWTDEEVRLAHKFTDQLFSIDKVLRADSDQTPTPTWMDSIRQPKKVAAINSEIEEIQDRINKLAIEKGDKLKSKKQVARFTSLLFEKGKALESAIEDSLELLGYEVENLREGDLEIDHVITRAGGIRMIGESEGKDSAAIGIAKFRQLESNIGEDFERDEIDLPAKGIIFGNAYRLIAPGKRKPFFTDKCLTNADRLGIALVRTVDLYDVVLHILDNPSDVEFVETCRDALENTSGNIVDFNLQKWN